MTGKTTLGVNNPTMYLFFFFSYLSFFAFSYLWVDFNLSLTHWPLLVHFLDKFQHWGYFHRPLSAKIYLGLLLLLFGGQLYLLFSDFLKRQPIRKLLIWAGFTTMIVALAYPFLSYDIFSYLFDAKIIWHYHQNPYFYAPNHFAGDPWLRFMRWTHRTCPYGPVWLLYTLAPGFLSLGKFVFNLYFLKIFNGLLFFAAGWLLLKMGDNDKKVFVYWFFNPFLIMELLVDAHNELLMIVLLFLALFLLEKRRVRWGFLAFLSSAAVKYISVFLAPLLFIPRGRRKIFYLMAGIGLLAIFIDKTASFQPWYFTWFFMVLPFLALDNFSWLGVFLGELLILSFKYYPFVLTGSWQETGHFLIMRLIFVFLGILALVSCTSKVDSL